MANNDSRPPITGVVFGLTSAFLFGASTPLAKLLIGEIPPVMLAGLLYLGSGIGLSIWWFLRPKSMATNRSISRGDLPYLSGAVLFGGVLGPVLLMIGLANTLASSASLLLNLEGVLTAVLAWVVFNENCDRRIVAGMVAITAGGALLSVVGQSGFGLSWGSILIVLACLCWAIDNNIVQKISSADPAQIALIKGLVAGTVNLSIAFLLGASLPAIPSIGASLLIGFLGYGVSFALFVLALRHVGTARTGAYFSTAPFVGAALSIVLLSEPLYWQFFVAAVLMGIGVWLHVTETHDHEHFHEPMEHDHEHVHDEHHQHQHSPDDPPGEPHSHWHKHEAITHSHPHYPDLHHRHEH